MNKKHIFEILKIAVPVVLMAAVVVFLFTLPPFEAETEETVIDKEWYSEYKTDGKAGFVPVCETDSLSLEADFKTGDFVVTNKQNSRKYYSSPLDRESVPEDINGNNKTRLFSQMLVYHTELETGESTMTTSFSGSLGLSGLNVEKLENGIKITYAFSDEAFVTNMTVTLDGDRLVVSSNPSEYKYFGTRRIVKVSLLPYFGAGNTDAQGFIMVPDGSGGIINYNSGKSQYPSYREAVYGRDLVYSSEFRYPLSNKIFLPVFGMNNAGNAFICSISGGETSAEVEAHISGQYNHFNTVYSTFTVAANDSVTVGDGARGGSKDVSKFNFTAPLMEKCELTYMLSGDDATHSDMAWQYREYLTESEQLGEGEYNDTRLMLSVFGGMKKKESFLGFMSDRYKVLTTYGEAGEMADALKSGGVDNLTLLYTNWSADEANRKNQSGFKPAPQLGGKNGLDKLKESQGNLYLTYDAFNIRKSGNGFSTFFDSAKRINNAALKANQYSIATKYLDKRIEPVILPSLKKIPELFKKFAESLEKSNYGGTYYPTMGGTVYSSFASKEFTQREQMKNEITELLKGTKNNIINSPNLYAIPYADYIVELPMSTSGQNIIDYDIPFAQMVLSGIKGYTGTLANHCADSRELMLKSIETSSDLYYSVVKNDPAVFMESEYTSMYGTYFDSFKGDIESNYKELKELYGKLGSRRIISHFMVSRGVFVTEYETGKRVIINYTNESAEFDGHTVEARGYTVY